MKIKTKLEAINKIKFLMKYDGSLTLNENLNRGELIEASPLRRALRDIAGSITRNIENDMARNLTNIIDKTTGKILNPAEIIEQIEKGTLDLVNARLVRNFLLKSTDTPNAIKTNLIPSLVRDGNVIRKYAASSIDDIKQSLMDHGYPPDTSEEIAQLLKSGTSSSTTGAAQGASQGLPIITADIKQQATDLLIKSGINMTQYQYQDAFNRISDEISNNMAAGKSLKQISDETLRSLQDLRKQIQDSISTASPANAQASNSKLTIINKVIGSIIKHTGDVLNISTTNAATVVKAIGSISVVSGIILGFFAIEVWKHGAVPTITQLATTGLQSSNGQSTDPTWVKGAGQINMPLLQKIWDTVDAKGKAISDSNHVPYPNINTWINDDLSTENRVIDFYNKDAETLKQWGVDIGTLDDFKKATGGVK